MNHDLAFVVSLDERTDWGQVFPEMFHPFLASYNCAIRPVKSTGIPIQFVFRQFFVKGYRALPWEIMVGPATIFATPGKQILRITRYTGKSMVKENEHLVVPSKWDAQMFVNDGIKNEQIQVLPWGFNSEIFERVEKPVPNNLLFGTTFNQQFPIVLESFKNAFPRRDDVRLQVRIFDGAQPDPGDHRVRFVPGRMQPYQTADWFRNLDVYITIKKGGSGLSAIQAMACGTPVLGDYIGSKTEYFNNTNGFPVCPEPDLHRNLTHEMRRIYFERELVSERAQKASIFPWYYFQLTIGSILQKHGIFPERRRRRGHCLFDADNPGFERGSSVPDPIQLHPGKNDPGPFGEYRPAFIDPAVYPFSGTALWPGM